MKVFSMVSLFVLTCVLIFAGGDGVYFFNKSVSDWLNVNPGESRGKIFSLNTSNQPTKFTVSDKPSTNLNKDATMVYVWIEYTDVDVHIDLPGDWMVGGVTIFADATPNKKVMLEFRTSGDLTNGANVIDTYYYTYHGNSDSFVPTKGLPDPTDKNPAWRSAEDLIFQWQNFSLGPGNQYVKIWLGVRIPRTVPKGNYSGWVDFTVSQNP